MWTLCQEKREKIIYACVQRELFVFSSCWEQKCIIMCARLKMRDTWHMTMCKCRLVALSFALCTLSPAWCRCMSRSISVSLSPSSRHPSATYHSVFTLHNLCERMSESSERKGGVAVDNVCKFVRDHPVLCNKYTALFCLLLCLFVSFFSLSLVLSLPEAFLLSRKLFANLHPPLICSPSPSSIYPSIHASMPSLGWQWCRAEAPWIIYQAGLFFPALLPTFGSPRRWGTFGEAHASHTRKDIINNLSCVDCPMHVCLVKQPESVVVEESIRFRLQGDDW